MALSAVLIALVVSAALNAENDVIDMDMEQDEALEDAREQPSFLEPETLDMLDEFCAFPFLRTSVLSGALGVLGSSTSPDNTSIGSSTHFTYFYIQYLLEVQWSLQLIVQYL